MRMHGKLDNRILFCMYYPLCDRVCRLMGYRFWDRLATSMGFCLEEVR
jgi:hypothetical protein